MTLRPIVFAFVLWLLLPGMTAAHPRAFVAVETPDIARAVSWYARVFGAETVNSFSETDYEIRILRGPDLIIELVQRKPARPNTVEGHSGLLKSGVVIDDFDHAVQRWTADGITMRGRRIHDRALGLDTVVLEDPDGNMIQVFGPGS